MNYVNFLPNFLQGLKGPIKYENCLQIMAQISSTNPEIFIDGETPQLIPFYTLGLIYVYLYAKNNFLIIKKTILNLRKYFLK